MSSMISVNVGFITNSSSVIHSYPAAVMNHPSVKAIVDAYEVNDGYVGSDLWNRKDCESFLVTKDQKEMANTQFREQDYGPGPCFDTNSDDLVVIYGDEYECLTSVLCETMTEAAKELGLAGGYGQDYN